MQKRSSKNMPKDANQLAAQIVAMSTGQAVPSSAELAGKNPAAVMLGRLGGLKGGKARAKSLSANERKAIAKKAAKARWVGKRK